MKHVLETKMEKVDGFSRRLDWKVGIENDNDNQILIKITRDKDKEIVKVIEEIKKVKVRVL